MMNVEKLRSSTAWLGIRDAFYGNLDGEACIGALSRLVEREITRIMRAGDHEPTQRACTQDSFALFAASGFGRSEIFPFSDANLLFLHRGDLPPEALDAAVRLLTQTLWDLGLEPSYSVRSLREVAYFQSGEPEFYLSLLDARPLAGPPDLALEFEEARVQLLREKRDRIAASLFDLIDARWYGHQHTVRHLEPDIKDGPGGLGDLHSLRWLTRLKGEIPFWKQPGRWSVFEPEARAHFAALRCFLHFEEQRNQNVLRFDLLEEWLERLARHGRDILRWPREHYDISRTIFRELERWEERYYTSNSALMLGLEKWRNRLSNNEFSVSRNRLYARNAHELETDEARVWRLFSFAGQHGVDLGADTIERVQRFLARPELAPGAHTSLRASSGQCSKRRMPMWRFVPWSEQVSSRPYFRSGTRLIPSWCGIITIAIPSMSIRWFVLTRSVN
ncbi:MAG: hypothetical protein LC114_03575 [Bryobacterales bacterium]|nr:hypothetical protein [Bryobacterales bacterium]